MIIKKEKKSIGVIGGMGPLATVDFFKKIVLLTKADKDQDHIPIIIDNNTSIPDRSKYITNRESVSPYYELKKSAEKLQYLNVNCITIPCNTAHYFYDQLNAEIKIPILNMIEIAAETVKEEFSSISKIGLMGTKGTCDSKIYHSIFSKHNIEIVIPDKIHQNIISNSIYGYKSGNKNFDFKLIYEVINFLESSGSELIVLGCTELPLIFEMLHITDKYIDTSFLLAKKAITFSEKEIRYEYKDKYHF